MVAHEKRNSAQLFCAVPTQNDLALSSLLFSTHPTQKLGYPASVVLVKNLISCLTSKLGNATIMTRKLGEGCFMKKEEILNASRNENKNRDLVELDVIYQAGIYASRVGAFVCCIISVLYSVLMHTLPYSPWIIYFSIITTQWSVRFIKLRHKSDLVLAVLFLSLGVLSFVGFVYRLLEVRA